MNLGYIRVMLCLAIVLTAPCTFGAGEDKALTPVQATVLDHNEFPCVNCLFGMSDYYVCFDAGSKIVIGHEKVRTDARRHYPTALTERGKTFSVRFDDKFIWVDEPGVKKPVKLTQDYTKKIFLSSDKCQAAIK
jgi:hypothetical protein